MVYTWSFAAGKASFRCKLTDNDTEYDGFSPVLFNQSQPDERYCKTNVKISVKECQRCYIKTISSMNITEVEACKEFLFDRKYYQYTLVEEVRSQIFEENHFSFILFLVEYGLRSNCISFSSTKYLLYWLYGWIDLFRDRCR